MDNPTNYQFVNIKLSYNISIDNVSAQEDIALKNYEL